MKDLKEGLSYVMNSDVHKTGTLAIVVINLFMIGPILISFPIIVEGLGGASPGVKSPRRGPCTWNVHREYLHRYLEHEKTAGECCFYSTPREFPSVYCFQQNGSVRAAHFARSIDGIRCYVCIFAYGYDGAGKNRKK